MASNLFRLSHSPCKQPECQCTDKTDLELAGLFYGNMLFIELSLEQYNKSWYIGAMVGAAACHNAEQGSSPHKVKIKKKIAMK